MSMEELCLDRFCNEQPNESWLSLWFHSIFINDVMLCHQLRAHITPHLPRSPSVIIVARLHSGLSYARLAYQSTG